ncbi:hypothetical protein D3C78_1538270 [compost metagenome]
MDELSLGTVVKTAVQTTVTDTITMFGELLPIALTVFAFTWGVRKGMRFFKSAAN